jgi:hypothetical protein
MLLEFIAVYFAAAIATGIVSWWYIFWPLTKEAIQLGIKNDITRAPYLSSFVFIVINTIFAPIVTVIIFVPSFFEAAKTGILKSISEED